MLVLYVDDGQLCSTNKKYAQDVLGFLRSHFEMTIGNAKMFLGMEIQIDQTKGELKLSSRHYVNRLLSKFSMENCNPVLTPSDVNQKLEPSEEEQNLDVPYQEAVGALMYLAVTTRPDIMYSVSKCAQFCNNFSSSHWVAVKRIFRYLQLTKDFGISFVRSQNLTLKAYCDSDYASDLATRR